MNMWCWAAVGMALILVMYGIYTWGFVDGCEHASETLTEEIMDWTDKMEEKYCQEEEAE